MKLAIFDVDLTLTKKDTFIEFYKFLCKEDKRFLLYFNKVISSGILYGLNIYDEKKTKEQYLSFLNGVSVESINFLAKKFYSEYIYKKLLYKDALKEIEKRKSQGYVVILISASPEFYLKEFHNLDIDYVLGTRYESKNGVYTGKMIGCNNKGEEKVKRLFKLLSEENITNVDFEQCCMYSDSLYDLPLLNLVGKGYLINSNKKINNITNLNWK